MISNFQISPTEAEFLVHPSSKWYFVATASAEGDDGFTRWYTVCNWGGMAAYDPNISPTANSALGKFLGRAGQTQVLHGTAHWSSKRQEKRKKGYVRSTNWEPPLVDMRSFADKAAQLEGDPWAWAVKPDDSPAEPGQAKPKRSRIRKTDYHARIVKAMQIDDLVGLLKARDGIREDIAAEQERLDIGLANLALLENIIANRLNA